MLVAACAVYAQIPNVSGRVTSTDGSPVAGAVVSDGLNCTQTDSDGRYTLTSDLENRHFIMLSVPAEYEIPARHSLPIPFKRIPRYVETFTADFVLEPRKESSDHHTLIVQGDPQIKDFFWDNSAEAYRDVVIPDIIKTRKSIATPCYGIELGDVIYNELTVYPVYLHICFILCDLKRDLHCKCSSLPLFTFYLNRSIHQFCQVLCDRHA